MTPSLPAAARGLRRHPRRAAPRRRARRRAGARRGDRERDRARGDARRVRHAAVPGRRAASAWTAPTSSSRTAGGAARRAAAHDAPRGRARSPACPPRTSTPRRWRSTRDGAAALAALYAVRLGRPGGAARRGAGRRGRLAASGCGPSTSTSRSSRAPRRDGRRAGYGVSPGDEQHPEPYLYVGPWASRPRPRRGTPSASRAPSSATPRCSPRRTRGPRRSAFFRGAPWRRAGDRVTRRTGCHGHDPLSLAPRVQRAAPRRRRRARRGRRARAARWATATLAIGVGAGLLGVRGRRARRGVLPGDRLRRGRRACAPGAPDGARRAGPRCAGILAACAPALALIVARPADRHRLRVRRRVAPRRPRRPPPGRRRRRRRRPAARPRRRRSTAAAS